MRSVMSRSPFSRSTRQSQEPYSFRADRDDIGTQVPSLRRLEARRALEESRYLAARSQARKYNPPVDLRLLDYVSTYDNNLMCPICRCPFVDPVILGECDHGFCRDCIHRTWSTGSPAGLRGNCPSCRTPAKLGPRSTASKILVNMTDDLIVRCPKSEEGCKAEVKRGEVQDHMTIYCPFALEECSAKGCELPLLRKDASKGCLHYSVCCLACRREMQKWRLEAHWNNECTERKLKCDLCKCEIFYRDLEEHNKRSCPATNIPCPAEAFGCDHRSTHSQAATHAAECLLAKLAPALIKQQERLQEQEAAQRQLIRKVEVLETGFDAIQSILYPAERNDDSSVSNVGRIDMADAGSIGLEPASDVTDTLNDLVTTSAGLDVPARHSEIAPRAPAPRLRNLPEPYTTDFDLQTDASFPPPATQGGPYASPLHHLLSMHESLRDEVTRMSSALSELEGRQSMQILNENLRTREEISYLGAQVGGLQRQVHWLTSAQLQRQQGGLSPTPGAISSASTSISDAAAGAGVEAAVSAVSNAATALRGAARMVSGGGREGTGMRRRPSEEGRTKL